MEIAVSYSRKLNHALYGGNQYESSDFFASLKMEVDDSEDPTGIHHDLSEVCRSMVNKAADEEIMDISGGLTPSEWDRCVQDALQQRWGDVETYNRMSPYQKEHIQRMKRAFKRIKYQENHA